MRFNFDITSTDDPKTLTPTDPQLQWVPLQNHPLFSSTTTTAAVPENLLAWDGASRVYYWDSAKQCLNRISIRLGEPDPTSVLAASPAKALQADVPLNFVVNRISINRNGSAILLAGLDGLRVMYLYGRSSTQVNTTICRTVSIGSDIYFNQNNVIRTLQISWHPYSDTHVGILSSDSVFRLFDLSSSVGQPEQEYYLQPVESGRSRNAASIRPVDFSFGGDHLWDKFSVFILFSDGAVYILCPVAPFGGVYKWDSLLEIYTDAQTYGRRSSNSKSVSNSSCAISWLEATFPELAHESLEVGNLSAVKAQPYALFDASISLQGPLQKVCHGGEETNEFQAAECEGRAVSFLYNSVSKDSILITAWSGGQLQVDALADEIQPLWALDCPPRLRVDSYDRIVGVAMICESLRQNSIVQLDQSPDPTPWMGHPPPLLRLAIVDLALPKTKESGSRISMFIDPLVPERIYSIHDGGVDSIVLHFLPFTSQASGKHEIMRTPSVHSVLNTCQGDSSTQSPLSGFIALSDSFGSSWIVGLTSSNECVVLEMETWNLLIPIDIDQGKKALNIEEPKESGTSTIISKELLGGPKAVLLPPSTPFLRSANADSIEGRSTLHQYIKLFNENYVEYAHKVWFELERHGPQLKKIIDDQHARLREAHQRLSKVEEKQGKLDERTGRVVQRHNLLEERLQSLRKLPGVHKKPLSKAEREFKSELDMFREVELEALHSSIEALNARLKRYTHSLRSKVSGQHRLPGRKTQDDQISALRSAVEKLSLVNSENTEKVKMVESALKSRDSTDF